MSPVRLRMSAIGRRIRVTIIIIMIGEGLRLWPGNEANPLETEDEHEGKVPRYLDISNWESHSVDRHELETATKALVFLTERKQD